MSRPRLMCLRVVASGIAGSLLLLSGVYVMGRSFPTGYADSVDVTALVQVLVDNSGPVDKDWYAGRICRPLPAHASSGGMKQKEDERKE
ncbi:hypothetical protein A606_06340 [Corynebacterium terpenotabidum Y-11]|uniref:Uncharacterized protein n=1 Tax=Corynebacterium terpenotabidum Y-11 TaxID=1200352 RepID=S4XGY1_9CORY|nr:hypothetical protein A606_06340 [Corynebacterium terpenotabidum Y-11]